MNANTSKVNRKKITATAIFTSLIIFFLLIHSSAQAEWSTQFSSLPPGNGMNAAVFSIVFDDISNNLYSGGEFITAGGVSVSRIAKWDGTIWSPLATGMNNSVSTIALDNTGNLFAGGRFTTAGGTPANRIAKWDGANWSALGTGMNGYVYTIAFDSAGNLYAGGSFTTAGGISANRIAMWNGAFWSPIGSGMNDTVWDIVFDSAGNLYAGGAFTTAGGAPANRIAVWNGMTWSPMGNGMNNYIRVLAFDSTGDLYAGGSFTTVDGVPANRIARWNGTSWFPLGAGINNETYSIEFDSAGNLYTGGGFTSAGGVSIIGVAKWDGATWSALGTGINAWADTLAFNSSGNLFVGGGFTTAGGTDSSRIGLWIPPPTILSVSSTSADGTYGTALIVPITVTFDMPVNVTGNPQITLETGTTDAVVDYTSGSGTATITFSYTVAAGHTSDDLDYISTAALILNGGTIKNLANTADAVLTLPVPGSSNSLGANKAIVIETTAPTVTSVTSATADGTYSSGAIIDIIVNFSENIFVTATPKIELETGISNAIVNYNAGSGTNELTFIYTVATDHYTNDLDYTSTNALFGSMGVTLKDGAGNDAILTLPVPGSPGSLGANKAIVINICPVAVNDNYNTGEDTPLNIAAPGVLSNDTDANGNPLTAIKITDPTNGALTFNSNGSFTYTPNANWNGADSFTYKANDGFNDSASAAVKINVGAFNDSPVINSQTPDPLATAEDTPLTIIVGNLNITDPDNSVFTLTVQAGTNYTVSGTTITPAANFNGTLTVPVFVNDGSADSNIFNLKVNAGAVNDPPVAANETYIVTQDRPLVIPAAGVLANDTDTDSPALTAVLSSGPAHGTLTLNPNGGFTYTPNAGYTGPDGFTYAATDGNSNSNIAAIGINVGKNTSPIVIAPIPDITTDEDSPDMFINLANHFTDNEDGPAGLNYTTSGSNHKVSAYAQGTTLIIHFYPNAMGGPFEITAYATDTHGEMVSDKFLITVKNIPDAPIAVNDPNPNNLDDPAYITAEDTELTVQAPGVLANDYDDAAKPLSVYDWTNPENGTVTMNWDGSFIYMPNPDFSGKDKFTYRITNGNMTSNYGTVTITITGINDAPQASDDSFNAEAGKFIINSVLTNDVDPDGDVMTAVISGNGPAAGIFDLKSDGTLYYIAPPNRATVSFSYTACDAKLCSSPALITITIIGDNTTPAAVNDAYEINEDSVCSISAPGLLANDTDANFDVLTVKSAVNPAHGTLVWQPDGSFIYTPTENFNGTDGFTYIASDGTLDSEPAAVVITILPDAEIDSDADGFNTETDCNDSNPAIYPGAVELCDKIDNNCNVVIDEGCPVYVDSDSDGFNTDKDCNDSNPSIYPGAVEICDKIDNNCNGAIDEGCPIYVDSDSDGFNTDKDCNDSNPSIYPGAVETCDNIDNNCNGVIDEGCPKDNDGDGFTNNADCNDTNPAIYPGAVEICDNIDNNCNGVIDEGCPTDPADVEVDSDADGFNTETDCNDSNPAIYPGAVEICDNIDNNCNGVIDEGCPTDPADVEVDSDADGFNTETDCNDTNPAIYPGAVELCDNIDNNCNGVIDEGCPTDPADVEVDSDADGFNTETDCNDTNPAIYPGAVELCDTIDNNCNGVIDENCSTDPADVEVDSDADGFNTETDCNDTNPAIYPGAVELCDTIDNNCNGVIDENCSTDPTDVEVDSDADGFNTETDCNDSNPAINPGAVELCDTIDNNCNGVIDENCSTDVEVDSDADGFNTETDCDDSNPAINPGAVETCDNIDNNCNGVIDEGCPTDPADVEVDSDADGFNTNADCNDTNPAIYPGAVEICDNIDNNCNGVIDEGCPTDPADVEVDSDADGFNTDTDCNDSNPAIYPGAVEICDNIDNNCNGVIDEGCSNPVPDDTDTPEVKNISQVNTINGFMLQILAGNINKLAIFILTPDGEVAAAEIEIEIIGNAYVYQWIPNSDLWTKQLFDSPSGGQTTYDITFRIADISETGEQRTLSTYNAKHVLTNAPDSSDTDKPCLTCDDSDSRCFISTAGSISSRNISAILFILAGAAIFRIIKYIGKITMKNLTLIIVCIIIITAIPAQSQEFRDYVGIYGIFAVENIDDKNAKEKFAEPMNLSFDDSMGVQFRGGIMSGYWSVEFMLEYIRPFEAEFDGGSAETDVFTATINGKISFPVEPFKPYILLGAGVMNTKDDVNFQGESCDTNEWGAALRTVIGADIRLANAVSLGLEAAYVFGAGNTDHIAYTAICAGMRYYF